MRKYQTMCHHGERPHMSYSTPRITHHAPHNHGQSSSLLDGKLDGAAKGCFASRMSSFHVRQHAMRMNQSTCAFVAACVLWLPRARSCCSPLFNKPNQHNVCPRRRCSLETHVDHGVRCKLTPHTACLSASRRAERAQDAIVRLCVVRGAWCVVQEKACRTCDCMWTSRIWN